MAGALSKMGAFALVKLAVPLCPQLSAVAAPWLIVMAVISILYGAVMALRQEDIKLLVAYSSLSHMGYIVLGVFSVRVCVRARVCACGGGGEGPWCAGTAAHTEPSEAEPRTQRCACGVGVERGRKGRSRAQVG